MVIHEVLECETVDTPYGPAQRVQVCRLDLRPMFWRELYDVLQERYPRRWWLMSGPWPELMLDNVNKYHVFVLAEGVRPLEFDLMREVKL